MTTRRSNIIFERRFPTPFGRFPKPFFTIRFLKKRPARRNFQAGRIFVRQKSGKTIASAVLCGKSLLCKNQRRKLHFALEYFGKIKRVGKSAEYFSLLFGKNALLLPGGGNFLVSVQCARFDRLKTERTFTKVCPVA